MWKPQWKFKQQPLTQKKKPIFLVDFNINGHSIKNAELPFLCFRYNGYCLYHLFKNNIYMLKINITVCFKIALTFSFSHLLVLSLSHSITLILPLWHTLLHTYTVRPSFVPKYSQAKKKETINIWFQCTLNYWIRNLLCLLPPPN